MQCNSFFSVSETSKTFLFYAKRISRLEFELKLGQLMYFKIGIHCFLAWCSLRCSVFSPSIFVSDIDGLAEKDS